MTSEQYDWKGAQNQRVGGNSNVIEGEPRSRTLSDWRDHWEDRLTEMRLSGDTTFQDEENAAWHVRYFTDAIARALYWENLWIERGYIKRKDDKQCQ